MGTIGYAEVHGTFVSSYHSIQQFKAHEQTRCRKHQIHRIDLVALHVILYANYVHA